MSSGSAGGGVVLVAPHWGAWIEIWRERPGRMWGYVAPHWGAWIEMSSSTRTPDVLDGRTPLGCVD